ncbi:hypothetical protein BCR44DRAFT_28287 [Catenaria anguillulae PL171]|uniref:SGNH hydrolase-type esterase domain-containing protein n=1 Tax=Catenaria anguillulae PL171 TaxID=765915 RepID=A0A1Y2I0I5_9FUNG|nr:hypothetical protein BCR44DRAFT_28287 [Catenaria anguillulae PL171]
MPATTDPTPAPALAPAASLRRRGNDTNHDSDDGKRNPVPVDVALMDDPTGKAKARTKSTSLLSPIWAILGQVHYWLHLVWISILRAVTLPWFYPNEERFHHIIVAGDDHALGVGDWCTPGSKVGLANRIQYSLIAQKILRHTWRPVNMGAHGTTTRDWIPSTSTFKRTFLRGSPEQRHRDVVVLLLGTSDAWRGIDGKETASNIRTIAEILADEYGLVFVCTIPNWMVSVKDTLEGQEKRAFEEMNAANAALRMWFKELRKSRFLRVLLILLVSAPKNSMPETSNIKLGAEIDRTNIEYRLGKLYFHDYRHFSAMGYDKLSKDLSLIMAKPLRRIEFVEDQKYIH